MNLPDPVMWFFVLQEVFPVTFTNSGEPLIRRVSILNMDIQPWDMNVQQVSVQKWLVPTVKYYVMVGDGNYLMMNNEIVTSIQEGIKFIIILLNNNGFGSIGGLSQSIGSQRFGTKYRYRDKKPDS